MTMKKKIKYNKTRLETVQARIVTFAQNYRTSTITTKLSDEKLLVTAKLPNQSFYSSVRTAIMGAATGSHSKCSLDVHEQLRENQLSLTLSL